LSTDAPTNVFYYPLFTDFGTKASGNSFPASTAIGDVTGDGLPDALLTNAYYFDPDNDYKLFVYPQKSDGTLGSGVKYDTHIGYGEDAGITVLDANHDGRPDLALAERAGLEIFLQNASGTLDAGVLVPGTANMRYAVRTDFDSDGDDDLVALGDAGVLLMIQGPAGQFTSQTITADFAQDVKVADLNGDGQLDVAALVAASGIKVYQQGSGGTWTSKTYTAGIDFPQDIDVADVTGDGRADVVQTSGIYGAQLSVLVQQPDGTLGAPKDLPTASSPEGVQVADWDQDGLADILVAHSSAGIS
jgi:hypothetical protein